MLIRLAAELVRGDIMPDTDSILRCKSTPRADWIRVSHAIDGIFDKLRVYGIRVKEIADKLPRGESAEYRFKNFHRLLCERFGYGHDEKDWERDQLSLIEWIAKRYSRYETQPAAPVSVEINEIGANNKSQPAASNERLAAECLEFAAALDTRPDMDVYAVVSTHSVAILLREAASALRPSQVETTRVETGWLIEGDMDPHHGQTYVGVVGGPHKNLAVVFDASIALRFCREQDAQTVVDNVPWFRKNGPFRVAGHEWVAPRSSVEPRETSGNLPDYVRRVEQCVIGADVEPLTHDWARIRFDLHELRRLRSSVEPRETPAYTEEAQEIRESAQRDLAYYNGAQQAAAMAHQSLQAMDKWIAGGCGGRWSAAKQALAGLPSEPPQCWACKEGWRKDGGMHWIGSSAVACSAVEPECRSCNGSGTTECLHGAGPDAYPVEIDCPKCKGTGVATPENGTTEQT
jgi:hypothetical protein